MSRSYGTRRGRSSARPRRSKSRNAVPRPSGPMVSAVPAQHLSPADSALEDRNFRTNVLLLFLGSNMVMILLFTSSVFTNWINSHFTSATSGAFNPYLVRTAERTRRACTANALPDGHLLRRARPVGHAVHRLCPIPHLQALRPLACTLVSF